MSGGDFDFEPEKGLPAKLPAGERVLWKGAPSAWGLAVRVFHVRKVAAYFVLLALWKASSAVSAGASAMEAATRAAAMLPLLLLAVAILSLLAWGYARTTVYTVTDKRLVIRSGIAVPASINLPFAQIDGVALKLFGDGQGDIPLIPTEKERIPAILLWPHLRPWRLKRPQPMLRSVKDAVHVASLLTAALKGQPAKMQVRAAMPDGAGLPQPA